MFRTLYIIGNGFDLHHRLPTSYSDFGNYLAESAPEVHECITSYFSDGNHLWGEFESALADLDVDDIIETNSVLLRDTSSDEWSDSYNHDFPYEIDRLATMLSSEMYRYFCEWISQVYIENAVPDLFIDQSAVFLTFNYTKTLEEKYGIPPAQINHIHGEIDNLENKIVLGHEYFFNPREFFSLENEDSDSRVIEAERRISEYFKLTFKPIKQIMANNACFFSSLHSVEQILILGHSISSVDYPYFQEIVKYIDVASVEWKCSFHNEQDKDVFKKFAFEVGIDVRKYTFFRMEELSR